MKQKEKIVTVLKYFHVKYYAWALLVLYSGVILAQDGSKEYNEAIVFRSGKDFVKAKQKLTEAIALGNAKAMNTMGLLYMFGEGVIPSYDAAFMCFQKAAKKGLPEAMYQAAMCYYTGTGIANNNLKGDAWMRLAAKAGNKQALAVVGSLN